MNSSRKKCPKCKNWLSRSQFSKDKSKKDGRQSWCKTCVKAYQQTNKKKIEVYSKGYNQEHKEEIRVYSKVYNREHKEEIKGRSRVWRQKNKKKLKVGRKTYYWTHKEEKKVSSKIYYETNKKKVLARSKARYQVHKERDKARIKIWRQKNKGLVRANTRKYQAAKLNRTPGWLTFKQEQQIKDFYINCPKGMVVDHIIPLQGKYVSGLHHPDNLQYLTKSENSKKGNNYYVEGR